MARSKLNSLTIIEAIEDPLLFGQFIKDQATFTNWKIVLKAFFGLPLSPDEMPIFTALTDRSQAPETRCDELWLIVGRRAGKSFITALVAVFLAIFIDYSECISAGESLYIPIIAPTKKQAKVIRKYCLAFITKNRLLNSYYLGKAGTEIYLKNGITIEIMASKNFSVRGPSYAAVIIDEAAFLAADSEGVTDVELLRAVRPALATTGGPIIGLSSPYAKRGVLYDVFQKHFGKNGSTKLVIKADSKMLNPTIKQKVIDAAYSDDATAANTEWGGEFRQDIESYISTEALSAVIEPGCHELLPRCDYSYLAFVDPSGGSNDSMTLAIGHTENELRVLDCIREVKPPFSPDAVCRDFAALLKTYRIYSVTGDKYAGEWPRERFAAYEIGYNVSERTKNDIYLEFLPLANSGRVRLLDHNKMQAQFIGLERRTGKGKDSIDHAPKGHDDVCNSVAGALVNLACQVELDYMSTGVRRESAEMLESECFSSVKYSSRAMEKY